MAGPTLTSTTSTEAEMTHALSPEWRDPAALPEPAAVPAAETPEAEETQPETAAASETVEKPAESKPRTKAQRAIDKLTAKNYQLAKDLEEARKAKPAETPAATAQPQGPPQLKDFKTPEEWADARDAWKEAKAADDEAQQERQTEFDTYNRGVSKLQATVDDWDEVINGPTANIPPFLGPIIVELGEEGAKVAYHLAKNPEACEELFELKRGAAIARIHEIAKTLGKPAAREGSPPPKQKVTPPAPISTVGGATSRSSVPLDQLPAREYIAIRNKQEQAKKHHGR